MLDENAFKAQIKNKNFDYQAKSLSFEYWNKTPNWQNSW